MILRVYSEWDHVISSWGHTCVRVRVTEHLSWNSRYPCRLMGQFTLTFPGATVQQSGGTPQQQAHRWIHVLVSENQQPSVVVWCRANKKNWKWIQDVRRFLFCWYFYKFLLVTYLILPLVLTLVVQKCNLNSKHKCWFLQTDKFWCWKCFSFAKEKK